MRNTYPHNNNYQRTRGHFSWRNTRIYYSEGGVCPGTQLLFLGVTLYLGYHQGVVNTNDSIPRCPIPHCTKEPLFVPSQRLLYGHSVAVVTADCLHWHLLHHCMCLGEIPVQTNYRYVQHIMLCSHLLDCFTQSAFFDLSQPWRRVTIQLFCHCRQPKGGKMVQCDWCMEWYHSQCETVQSGVCKSCCKTYIFKAEID